MLCAALVAGCGTSPPKTAPPANNVTTTGDSVAEIREVFEKYRGALLSGDGTKAAEAVDSATIGWYRDAAQHAVLLGREDVERLNLLRKFTVLRLRLEFRCSQLERRTGKELFVHGVDKGWISKSSVERIVLAAIIVDGGLAKASTTAQPLIPSFYFLHEGGGWKLALWKTFPMANAAWAKFRDESGLSENEYLLNMLRAVSKFEVDESLFDGPRD